MIARMKTGNLVRLLIALAAVVLALTACLGADLAVKDVCAPLYAMARNSADSVFVTSMALPSGYGPDTCGDALRWIREGSR